MKIENLCTKLSISQDGLKRLRRQYRMEHGKDADTELLKWLEHTWNEMKDEDSFLRAGALPSDLGGKVTNPRPTALSRGRSGTTRGPGDGRRRHHKQVIKPPTATQIAQASEQSAYVHFRDSLDAGVVPRSYQNVLDMEAHMRTAERRKQESQEADAREQSRHLAKQVHDVAIGMARSGTDPLPFLADVQRRVSAERDRLRDAA